jgi:hypothetical protein
MEGASSTRIPSGAVRKSRTCGKTVAARGSKKPVGLEAKPPIWGPTMNQP